MSTPGIWTDQSVYTVDFGDPAFVQFAFSRVRNASDGGVKAEVLTRSTAPGREEKLLRSDINVLAEQTVKRYAESVRARANGQGHLDWGGMLGRSIGEVLELFRRGEPAIYLRDAPEPEAGEYALEPLALARQPGILFGHGGGLKSSIGLAAGLSIHTGREILPGLVPPAARRVGLLDWEFDAWEHKKRMSHLVGDDMPDLVYARCSGALRDQVDRIKEIVREHRLEFLIVDSILPALGGDPLSAETALAFFGALRQIGLGALCVAHITKDGGEEMPFGSVMFHNLARLTWFAKKSQQPGQAVATVGLFNRKSNVGQLYRPLGFRWTWAGPEGSERVRIERTDVSVEPGLAEQMSIGTRVWRVLDQGALAVEEIHARLTAADPEIKVDSVRKAVNRMVTRGWLVTAGTTANRLTRYGRAASTPAEAGDGE